MSRKNIDHQALLKAFREEQTELRRKVRTLGQGLARLVGEKIGKARSKAKMTQSEFADIIGKTRTSISNIEAGRQNLNVTSLVILAHALGIEPKELIPTMDEILNDED